MLIIDGHLDLAWNATDLRRDLTRPLAELRAAEGPCPAHGQGTATVSLPALREAGVRVAFATIFVAPYDPEDGDANGYRTPQEAYERAMAQLAWYHRLAETGEVTLIRARGDLDAVLAGHAPAPGLALLMEGADYLRTPEDLAPFVEGGVRIVGPAWRANRYVGSCGEPGLFTGEGLALLREMARLGVALDLSHLAEEACRQALKLFPGPIVATHVNCRALVPLPRLLPDDLLRAVADRDGIIGLVLYNRFLRDGWTPAAGKASVTLADLLAHARHIADLIGPRHLGLGTDMDGGLGRESIPAELDSIADLPKVAEALRADGFDQDAVNAMMGENWVRVLEKILTP